MYLLILLVFLSSSLFAQVQMPLDLQPVVVKAKPDKVWSVLTDSAAVIEWAAATRIEQDFCTGGLREWMHPDTNIVQNIQHLGAFTVIEPPTKLGYWVMMDAQPIHFLLTLEARGDSTAMRVHAENFGEGKDGERRRNVSAIYWYQRFPRLREFFTKQVP